METLTQIDIILLYIILGCIVGLLLAIKLQLNKIMDILTSDDEEDEDSEETIESILSDYSLIISLDDIKVMAQIIIRNCYLNSNYMQHFDFDIWSPEDQKQIISNIAFILNSSTSNVKINDRMLINIWHNSKDHPMLRIGNPSFEFHNAKEFIRYTDTVILKHKLHEK